MTCALKVWVIKRGWVFLLTKSRADPITVVKFTFKMEMEN